MYFEKIKEQLTKLTPQIFLETIISSEQTEQGIFIFSPTLQKQLKQNIAYLSSNETITEKDLDTWENAGFQIVAQTIDGDYIAGTLDQTFIIPVSLYKSDVESYNLFIADFFIDYSLGRINSAILPMK